MTRLLAVLMCLLSLAGAPYAFGAVSVPAGEVPTPYLPSTPVAVEEMLRLAEVRADDLVVDLGSGDGRIPITAATAFGARGFGVDIDAKLVAEANDNARKAGVAERVHFVQRDVFEADLKDATVVTLYLLTGLVNRLKPKLLRELRPGARIVAHDFPFNDWTPDRRVNISKSYFLYIVPASVRGTWQLEATLGDTAHAYELSIEQDHQKIRGGARTGGAGFLPLFEPQLEGDRIRFVLVDEGQAHHFEGRVHGAFMEGKVRSGIGRDTIERAWRAERVLQSG
ncbi:MAG: class I SAM-dependent methyltransferase [Burkholderiales bacterium]|nr:class I SAM-dependent methyltransferase [Burkholderiales bacterium]